MVSHEGYVPRRLADELRTLADEFPIVSLSGPRQSGKSTLIHHLFPNASHVDLDNPDLRSAAQIDPVGFLERYPRPLVIDEAQNAPELFPMLKAASDESGDAGQFILSGSQNFLLMGTITQSLAGRVGIAHLLPFSASELKGASLSTSLEEDTLYGGYPRLRTTKMRASSFFRSYLQTYVERDVVGVLDIRNRTGFEKFLSVCATRAGAIINNTSMASACDISLPTAQSWISIMRSSFVIFALPAYSANLGKRLTKAPKLYFYDTGLLCHLLGIETTVQLVSHPLYGEIFENYVVAETLKKQLNQGKEPRLYFYRDDSKREVDLLDFTSANDPVMVEIKSNKTFRSTFGRHLTAIGAMLDIPPQRRILAYGGASHINGKQFVATPVTEWLSA